MGERDLVADEKEEVHRLSTVCGEVMHSISF